MEHMEQTNKPQPLSYAKTYQCPVCRRGEISSIALMDAFACSFCRHIFTANLSDQSLQIVDISPPMSWRWTGRTWRSTHHQNTDLAVSLWLAGLVLVILPAGVVGLSAYLFPPLEDSASSWFPIAWVSLTFMAHLLLVLVLLAEYYQPPLYVTLKIWLRALQARD